MSKVQVRAIAIAIFKASTTIIILLGKAFLSLAIALTVIGQLLFSEASQPISEDPWEDVAPIPAMAMSISPGAVLVLGDIPDVEKETIAQSVDSSRYQKMPLTQLRKECSAIGVEWRNVHGKSKHLTKKEMLEALQA
jgi:hypothetical protein